MQIITLIFGFILLFILARLLGKLVLYIPRLVACIFEMIIHFSVVEPLYKRNHPDDEEPHTPQGDYSPPNHITWSSDKHAPQDEATQEAVDTVKEVPSPGKPEDMPSSHEKNAAPDEANEASTSTEGDYVAPNRITWSSDKAATQNEKTQHAIDSVKEVSSPINESVPEEKADSNEATSTPPLSSSTSANSSVPQDDYVAPNRITWSSDRAVVNDDENTIKEPQKNEPSRQSSDPAESSYGVSFYQPETKVSAPHPSKSEPSGEPAPKTESKSKATSALPPSEEPSDNHENYHFKSATPLKQVGSPQHRKGEGREGRRSNSNEPSSPATQQESSPSSKGNGVTAQNAVPENNDVRNAQKLNRPKTIGALTKPHSPKKTIGRFLNTPSPQSSSSTPRNNYEVSRSA